MCFAIYLYFFTAFWHGYTINNVCVCLRRVYQFKQKHNRNHFFFILQIVEMVICHAVVLNIYPK